MQISYWLPGEEAAALEAAGEELFDGEEQKLYPSVGYNGMIYPLRNGGFHGLTGGVYKARERIHRGMLIRDY